MKEEFDVKWLLVGGLVVLVFILFLTKGTSETEIIPKETAGQPLVTEKHFIEGCLEEATYAQCKCAYDEIIKTHGQQGLIKMGFEYLETDELPEGLIDSILKCI
jgi:hypothetical protein